ncbi:MAG: hypothetical protein MUC88_04835 [Planctomycetes bacterium]|nr:hypothetical protein [Planctomycetota bacterium]
MLVVIAAIALLVALLVPALSRARKHARAVVCLSHLKQWGTSLALYTQDHEGRLPPDAINALWMPRSAAAGAAGPNEPASVQNVRMAGVACCPMATRPPGQPTMYFRLQNGQVEGSVGDVLAAWEITSPAPAFRGSYGMNSALSAPPPGGANFWMGGLGAGLETNIFLTQRMDRVPVLLDSVTPDGSGGANDAPPPDPFPRVRSRMGVFCIDRHQGHVNGLFLDWSVRRIGLKELWTLKWHPNFKTAGRWTRAGGVTPEQWPQWMRGMKDY